MANKDTYVDLLRVRVFSSRAEMGSCCAKEAAAYLRELLQHKDTVNVMFAAAPSQNEVLETLRNEDIDWTRVNAFHMDEYIGLPADHPAGFGNFLRRSIFDHLPFRAVHFLNGAAPDAKEECRRYGMLLKNHPLDICLLGVGENGHIAFNDPPTADFQDADTVKIVELEHTCRMQQVHDGCFPHLEDVPTHAMTVTIPALLHASRMYCAVPSQTKAPAVHAMLNGPIHTGCPASVLRRHPSASLYLDQAAASQWLGE